MAVDLISLLVFIIIIGILFWAVRQLAGAFNVPQPIVTVIYVLLVIICVLWLLQAFGLSAHLPALRIAR